MARIELERVTCRRHGGVVLRDVSLAIDDGEVLAVVGPSGAGKTTLLRVIAGLDEPASGEVRIGGRAMRDVPPWGRDLGMVGQDGALLPHLDVRGNMGFPLQLRGLSRAAVDDRVDAGARVLGLSHLLRRRPATLSHGERQRSAIGRATVRSPSAYLLDEPLSSVDAHQRAAVRVELGRHVRGAGVTTVYATNDQTEAMALADRIAVLRDGTLLELDTPHTLYTRPGWAFTAAFLGDPGMSVLSGTLEAGQRSGYVRVGEAALEVGRLPERVRRSWDARRVLVGVRPEDLSVHPGEGAAARVDLVASLGWANQLHLSVSGAPAGTPHMVARTPPHVRPRPGATVGVRIRDGRAHLFDPDDERAFWHPPG